MAYEADEVEVIGDDRKDLDPAVADQLTMQIITTGQQNAQLNSALGRSNLASTLNALTMGVQANQAASLKQLTSLSPQAAGAAAQLLGSQAATQAATLQAAARTPAGGAVPQ